MTTKKVILYFENQNDALRFTLAAGSVMAEGTGPSGGKDLMRLVQPLTRATRIRVGRTASQTDDSQVEAQAS